MIVFDNLWETLERQGISQYTLIHKFNVSSSQITRLKKNENVSTYTINRLCKILNCEVSDIMSFQREESSQ